MGYIFEYSQIAKFWKSWKAIQMKTYESWKRPLAIRYYSNASEKQLKVLSKKETQVQYEMLKNRKVAQ